MEFKSENYLYQSTLDSMLVKQIIKLLEKPNPSKSDIGLAWEHTKNMIKQ